MLDHSLFFLKKVLQFLNTFTPHIKIFHYLTNGISLLFGSIISTVVLPTTEIIEPYNKGARRGQLKKHRTSASLLPAELVK